MRQLENLLLFLARNLVDEPERVKVEARETDSRVDLTLHVAPDDIGKVIGRQGRTVKALRSLLHAAGQKQRRRYLLEIVE